MINEIINKLSNSTINQYILMEKNAQELSDQIEKTSSFRNDDCAKFMVSLK
jgi:hypothetical protein